MVVNLKRSQSEFLLHTSPFLANVLLNLTPKLLPAFSVSYLLRLNAPTKLIKKNLLVFFVQEFYKVQHRTPPFRELYSSNIELQLI